MVNALSAYVGKHALYQLGPDFAVWVHVLDVRSVFGRTDLKVQPHEGHGSRWVSLSAMHSFIEEM